MWCGSVASGRGAEGKQSDRPLPTGTRTEPAKKRSLTADRGGDPGSSRDREGLRLTEEQAERWQPIVQQRAESYVKQKANALKGADTRGFYDAVIVTKKGVVEGSEVYDHGLLTQFLLPEDNSKDSYKVVWEKAHPVENASFQGATAQRSEGNDPYRQASDMGNVAPTLSEIKSLYEEIDGNSHRGVTWQDPVSLKTIITLFEKADSSTLIHEIAHYCFNSMEEAIRDDDI